MTRNVKFSLCLILCLPLAGFSQSSLNLASDDPAYIHLNVLANAGLFSCDYLSTKPLTETSVRQLVSEARSKLDSTRGSSYYDQFAGSLRYLENQFPANASNGHTRQHLRQLLLQDFLFEYLGSDTPRRSLPEAYIDATLSSPESYKQGRIYHSGHNFAFETRHSLTVGRWFSAYFQGRLLFSRKSENAQALAGTYNAYRYYLTFSFWNLNLLIGKDALVWGTGNRGNLILSANAGPIGSANSLPLFKLENSRPVYLPWKLGAMGAAKFVLFISKLENQRRDFARPYFIGSRLTFQPSQRFEYGFSHTYILGGQGFPNSITFADGLAEFFFIRIKQNFIFNIDIGEVTLRDNIANHVMGFDFRFRFPNWRNLEFFSEFYFDDMTLNLRTTVKRNLAYYGGFWLPRLTSDGRVGFRLEYAHTSTIFYTGTPPLTSGYTYRGNILGNALGPFGNEVFIALMFKPGWQASFSPFVNFQSRGVGRETGESFIGLPGEKRWLLGGDFAWELQARTHLKFELGYEHISNFNNAASVARNGVWAGLSLLLSNPLNR